MLGRSTVFSFIFLFFFLCAKILPMIRKVNYHFVTLFISSIFILRRGKNIVNSVATVPIVLAATSSLVVEKKLRPLFASSLTFIR